MNAVVLAPLDTLRSAALRRLGRLAPNLLAHREARVGLLGTLTVASAFALSCLVPLWTLALGPIVLGVPHLLADVRYLVIRTALHRRRDFCLVVGGPLLATVAWPHSCVGLLAPVGAAIVAQGKAWIRGAVLLGAIAVWFWSREHVYVADLVVAHGHNLFAVGLWWAWIARHHRYHWPTLVGFAGGLVLIASGAIDAVVLRIGPYSIHSGLTLGMMIQELAPAGSGVVGLHLVLAFAFAQSVHYGVWLRLIPEDDRPRPGIRSFASSFRALQADVGTWLILLTGISCAVVVIWALLDVGVARHAYLRVAGFHAYLEAAVVALLVIEGRLPRRREC